MELSSKIILYRSTSPYWLVDATCGPEEGLSICSGDANAEWYVRVASENTDRLLFALRARKERLRLSDASVAYGDPVPDNELLKLLFENFGDGPSNPFTEIKQFFAESEIRATSDFWGSM